jgi:hypothetical protein
VKSTPGGRVCIWWYKPEVSLTNRIDRTGKKEQKHGTGNKEEEIGNRE